MNKRVLFLYISPSSGHQHAADATRAALSLLAPSWDTYGVDSLTYAYPAIGKWIAKTYLELLRRTPMIWDYLYDNPDVVTATQEIREVLNAISWPKLQRLIHHHNPQAIVCTQAVPCSVLASEKRKGTFHLPLIAVVTDFAIHAYWVYKEVDLYCVASEEVRQTLTRQGISASKIAVTGIPISPAFWRHTSQEQARHRLHLEPNKPTVLVMGGSQGLGPLQETIERLHAAGIQCLVATGLNRELFRSLRRRFGSDSSVRAFGYTRNIPTFMDAADLLITKPGGMTSSEALAKGLPMIITQPIPGQEERNARFLLKHGAAERADDPAALTVLAQQLFSHPERLARMREKVKVLAKPYSAMDVACWIYRLAGGDHPVGGTGWGALREYDRMPRVSRSPTAV